MNGAITVWVIIWRFAWPLVVAGAAIAAAAGLSHFRPLAASLPPIRAVAGPLLSPVLLVLWAGFNWDHRAGPAPTILTVVFVACLIVALVWPFMFRAAAGVGWVVAAGIVGFLYSCAAWFVGQMAISNTWL